ncbi:MAG: CO dehydrogenase/acetyl-CoA synthase subunit delta [Candidatus Methanoliparum thermophilum]|uniref:Acetyl-CoA decarbonylase/synthase complex subunit delta n=1 Tax=Methanoliparum thermophilum TaxID=2491083 RepID=A0A520KRZ9_METT2|nr:CO dehydrogenase/acetyl-CoA synthase subunit delta [Candidatus Methanoliparum sp. LAM-1]RZN64545.1 MAG: CO dehydrogenase/acetyl-CoA synthase subunit delta [Candidatus Methanoliparum thermophilum]BDC35857.1 acetyl-CoA synthase subunit D [Candidatus Methanoliparum sp. LAM-1]
MSENKDLSLSLKDIQNMLDNYGVEELKDIKIEGDLEIEVEPLSGGVSITPEMLQSMVVANEAKQAVYHISNLFKMFGLSLSFQDISTIPTPVQAPVTEEVLKPRFKPLENLIAKKFNVSKDEWRLKVEEITLGATKTDGGTRGNVIKIGGEQAMPFYCWDGNIPNRPVVALDVFDMPISLAKAVKVHYEDVVHDPGDWARKAVKDYKADMVTIHLISTDPLIKDTPAKEAAKAVEEVLQAVDVPIVIGGSGNPDKDPEVLEKAAEVAEGERCLIASANLDMDWERIGNAAKKYGHNILSWTQLDMNNQRELNRKLLKVVEMPRDRIVIDPTTAALGYGLDYAYTNMERIRLAALGGDDELSFPMSSGTTNAWGAREAWMINSPMPEDSDWGPREFRGPLWEIYTGLPLAIAGVDLFMMMHPLSVRVLKETTQTLLGMIEGEKVDISNWIKEV